MISRTLNNQGHERQGREGIPRENPPQGESPRTIEKVKECCRQKAEERKLERRKLCFRPGNVGQKPWVQPILP